jgi:nucleoid DNA-binding protein
MAGKKKAGRKAKKVAKKPLKKTAAKAVKRSKGKKTRVAKATRVKVSSSAMKPVPTNISAPFTKTELLTTLADASGLSRGQVKSVLEALTEVIAQHVKPRGPQLFTLPGLAKIKVIHKPATKAREGINPFTGEPTVFKAKPARNVVKVLALKRLKEMAAK